MFDLRNITATALIGALVSVAPLSANALVLRITDNDTTTVKTVADQSGDDLDGDAGSIAFTANVGNALIGLIASFYTDANGVSKLGLNVTNTSASALGDLWIDVTHTFFGAGAGDPTNVFFDMNASDLSTGGQVSGAAFVEDNNSEWSLPGTFVAGGVLTSVSDDIAGGVSTTLNDPFSMTIETTIQAGTTTSFDATMVASVPVPAAGLLLLTALGGLGLVRRKRKAA